MASRKGKLGKENDTRDEGDIFEGGNLNKGRKKKQENYNWWYTKEADELKG